MFEFGLNSEPVKYLLIVLTAPFWIPFFKALFKEFNDSLRDEGGLFGLPPTKEKLAEMNRELGKFRSPLVSELRQAPGHAERLDRRGGGPAPRARKPRGFGPPTR